MKEKNNIFLRILRWWNKGIYITNKDASTIIRNFVSGGGGQYEWDDFESVEHKNPETDLALRLCWFFARKYPAKKSTEYCGQQARRYFLIIADALESGQFNDLDFYSMKQSLKQGIMPEELANILKIQEQ